MKRIDEIGKIPLDGRAKDRAQGYVDEFALSVITQAKLIAYQLGDNIVLSRHIEEAFDIVNQKRQRAKWREYLITIGGTLLGAGLAGFLGELSQQRIRTEWISTWTVLLILGIALVSVTIFRGR